MQYNIQAANGHAGEYFFAYKIANDLKWPCRLIDVDIGIDAQVEVIDDTTRHSLGRFVAFQIKATDKANPSYFYTSQAHLDYWKTLQLPVIAVLIDLGNSTMYLHEIDAEKEYPLTEKKGEVIVKFDIAKDKFTASSAQLIAAAGLAGARSKVSNALYEVIEYCKSIHQTLERSRLEGLLLELLKLGQKRTEIRGLIEQARGIAMSVQAGEDLVNNASINVAEALYALRTKFRNSTVAADGVLDGPAFELLKKDLNAFLDEGH